MEKNSKSFSAKKDEAIKPSVELRNALDQAQKSQEFLEKGKFIDFLESINRQYLAGEGIVIKLDRQLSSSLFSDRKKTANLTFFELHEASGSSGISLEWKNDEAEKNTVAIYVHYHSKTDIYTMSMFAAANEHQEDKVLIGKSIQRNFWIKPDFSDSISKSDTEAVDNLLLTFIEELLEMGIL